ncbi:MAG: tRNA (adenosine(37)-N6)-dimethylallyltransferase MiaA [Candidatus Cloacimonadaceae bacterium]|jgi:tRNA dimethylallyltransferase|nr:tRNA (adenosine(37)-N6)-dimethylallyltransferase MiaA [Candidatus Cloacimonadota bacterium]MDY0319318.1 tRNA (adenosine(37)-N6)-dimethylallyltransferase MiaA [Candidatus Cloacimonadaceae bacterium]
MILCIEGPTASGKSALALMLARELGGQIVNADSRQVYRFMDIGTAKVSLEERQEVAHHLVDIIDPRERYNAGRFVSDAETAISEISKMNQIPIVCGGTGLYIRAFLDGLFEHPPLDPHLKERLQEELETIGAEAMYLKLQDCDPEFAAKISPKDPQRILRGLEVFLGTGKSISEHWQRQVREPRHKALRIFVDLPRAELYEKINLRVQLMMEQGLINEIKALLDMGYTWQDPGLNTMGYKEFQPYIEGLASSEECAQVVAQHHRNYAKRQLTWYRKCKFDLTICSHSFSLSDVLRDIKSRFMGLKEEYGEDHRQSC